tara:strand:- start:926 stop:1378 length:453 start_codon:yes stop_codon:yes gene_type:complete
LTVVGIDPGKSGGIAIISEDKVLAYKTPNTPHKMADIVRTVVNTANIDGDRIKVYIENVWAFPTDTRSSAFKFGMNYGMWFGILGTFKLPMIKITPQTWMKGYAPLPKIKKERKAMLKEIAQEMFPELKVTYSTADAILIAVYGGNNAEH